MFYCKIQWYLWHTFFKKKKNIYITLNTLYCKNIYMNNFRCVHIDIGCGSARNIIHVSKQHLNVLFIGIDIRFKWLFKAKKNAFCLNNVVIQYVQIENFICFFSTYNVLKIRSVSLYFSEPKLVKKLHHTFKDIIDYLINVCKVEYIIIKTDHLLLYKRFKYMLKTFNFIKIHYDSLKLQYHDNIFIKSMKNIDDEYVQDVIRCKTSFEKMFDHLKWSIKILIIRWCNMIIKKNDAKK